MKSLNRLRNLKKLLPYSCSLVLVSSFFKKHEILNKTKRKEFSTTREQSPHTKGRYKSSAASEQWENTAMRALPSPLPFNCNHFNPSAFALLQTSLTKVLINTPDIIFFIHPPQIIFILLPQLMLVLSRNGMFLAFGFGPGTAAASQQEGCSSLALG